MLWPVCFAASMHGAHEFLTALALVLCVAAVTTVVCQRLHQPVVLGYILAGLIIGPHVPIPLVANQDVVQTLSELGVILLMFSLGLEFSLRQLIRVAPTSGVTAFIQCGLMLWLGFICGRAFGWTALESTFAGAVLAISSTTIIAKAFDEQGIRGPLREVVVGILIVEDLIAILLMATLTAASSGSGLSAGALAVTVGKLAAFLVALIAVGLLVIPRSVRAIVRMKRPETTLIASVGICFAVSLLAQSAGYSVALGAFLAGSLVAESGEAKTVEHLVEPVKDVFAAVFFVSVGMLIDPALVVRNWAAVVVLTILVIVGKIVGVTVGAFLTGNGVRTSIRAGMSLAQIGEFSFIIAALGLSLGATRDFIYPVAVTVSALTTLTTPWLIRASGPVAGWVDRRLPHPLQTFLALYGSWIESLRRPATRPARPGLVRLGRLLILDTVLLTAVLIGSGRMAGRVRGLLEGLGLSTPLAQGVVLVGALALALPFCVGIVRLAGALGRELADRALPRPARGALDLAAAPRRVLMLTLQLAGIVVVGLPVVAVTQPFLPGGSAAVVLAVVVAGLAVGFWRSATELQGHVRAGAQAVVEALAAQSRSAPDADPALTDLHAVLPGIGEPAPFRVDGSSGAVGKTLAQLNLRGLSGATVLAIRRASDAVLVPTASERLREGDVLALAGTHEAVEAAKRILVGGGLDLADAD
jgi:monovalent cation:H+ antiporter-2, CPA2 family